MLKCLPNRGIGKELLLFANTLVLVHVLELMCQSIKVNCFALSGGEKYQMHPRAIQ